MTSVTGSGIAYDKYGRMRYNAEFHAQRGVPWTTLDQKYLIENYERFGPEQLSFELERTIGSIMQKVAMLRKQGVMPRSTRKYYRKHIGP